MDSARIRLQEGCVVAAGCVNPWSYIYINSSILLYIISIAPISTKASMALHSVQASQKAFALLAQMTFLQPGIQYEEFGRDVVRVTNRHF